MLRGVLEIPVVIPANYYAMLKRLFSQPTIEGPYILRVKAKVHKVAGMNQKVSVGKTFYPVVEAVGSRVKELVDLALLIGDRQLDRQIILNALHLTFERRKTHPLPATLDAPPPAWVIPYTALAEQCGL